MMYPDSDDGLRFGADQAPNLRRLTLHHARCAKAAKALFAAGAAVVLFLCLWGMRPAAIAVPVFCAATSLLFASASAALFARVAQLQLLDAKRGEDEDDHGRGGGPETPPDPPRGGGLDVDWERFERDFRSYCEDARLTRA